MQDNFESPVLAFTLAFEGGAVDDPRDPGGRTNQGVTQRTYAAYRKGLGLPAADVFAMTPAERTAIYRSGYWDPVGGANLPSGLDLACFDFAVNSGPARALRALKAASDAPALKGDAVAAIKALCAARLSFLHGLATFRTFGRGWTARVAACEALGVKMALHARVGRPVEDPPSRGAALVLTTEAQSAATQSATHARSARAASIVAVTGVAAAPVMGHHAVLIAGGCAGAGLALAALLFWRARQQAARARAFVVASKVP